MGDVAMKKSLMLAIAILFVAGNAEADVITLKLSNASALPLTALSAKSRDGTMATTVLSGSLAAGGAGSVQVTQTGASGGDCVYDLTLSFGTAKSQTLTNIDICQADGLKVE